MIYLSKKKLVYKIYNLKIVSVNLSLLFGMHQMLSRLNFIFCFTICHQHNFHLWITKLHVRFSKQITQLPIQSHLCLSLNHVWKECCIYFLNSAGTHSMLWVTNWHNWQPEKILLMSVAVKALNHTFTYCSATCSVRVLSFVPEILIPMSLF
jgi:hypothetical protein